MYAVAEAIVVLAKRIGAVPEVSDTGTTRNLIFGIVVGYDRGLYCVPQIIAHVAVPAAFDVCAVGIPLFVKEMPKSTVPGSNCTIEAPVDKCSKNVL